MTSPTPRQLVVERDVPAGHPAFPGHFPGQPLLPGVSLLAEVLEVAMAEPAFAARLAGGWSLQNAKFLSPVGPGARLVVDVTGDDAGLRFEVRQGEVAAARGQIAWGDAR